jgi:hypothetical protein
MGLLNYNFDARKHRIYIPRNPEKFLGTHAICRSSYEEKFCKWCDYNDDIVLWSSESIKILYYDPIRKRTRSYFPDFIIKKNTGEKFIIEVKPSRETEKPKRENKKPQNYLRESIIYATNLAKWNAAIKYCNANGYQFKIVTERSLGK